MRFKHNLNLGLRLVPVPLHKRHFFCIIRLQRHLLVMNFAELILLALLAHHLRASLMAAAAPC